MGYIQSEKWDTYRVKGEILYAEWKLGYTEGQVGYTYSRKWKTQEWDIYIESDILIK